ncbi:hypothetical protein EDEG_03647 [Edhazardia aedis USNM 41457]|uniref:Protein kinase domain-containing protein n=1 Tax=Edhazardia aedis (strain USNM 41457) TaxID=1003232 RepID=J8ZQA2_EDHAE|nr:hypothetical protein EDEG_03647 [Edhazardia aedis USNM 41457]|eukprot:EJW01873.1 hypothetical protein EDEG_03647 [Edhazardia aedis USNM 41457]
MTKSEMHIIAKTIYSMHENNISFNNLSPQSIKINDAGKIILVNFEDTIFHEKPVLEQNFTDEKLCSKEQINDQIMNMNYPFSYSNEDSNRHNDKFDKFENSNGFSNEVEYGKNVKKTGSKNIHNENQNFNKIYQKNQKNLLYDSPNSASKKYNIRTRKMSSESQETIEHCYYNGIHSDSSNEILKNNNFCKIDSTTENATNNLCKKNQNGAKKSCSIETKSIRNTIDENEYIQMLKDSVFSPTKNKSSHFIRQSSDFTKCTLNLQQDEYDSNFNKISCDFNIPNSKGALGDFLSESHRINKINNKKKHLRYFTNQNGNTEMFNNELSQSLLDQNSLFEHNHSKNKDANIFMKITHQKMSNSLLKKIQSVKHEIGYVGYRSSEIIMHNHNVIQLNDEMRYKGDIFAYAILLYRNIFNYNCFDFNTVDVEQNILKKSYKLHFISRPDTP